MATKTELVDQVVEQGLIPLRSRAERLNKSALEEMLAINGQLSPVEPKVSPQKAAWTPERKAAMAEKMRAHWATHTPPMTGKKLSEETKQLLSDKAKERNANATVRCALCNKFLTSSDSIAKGLGPTCQHKDVPEGFHDDGKEV